MKTIPGKIMLIAGLGGLGLLGLIYYSKIKALINLQKTLPQYLENIYGDLPEINLTITMTELQISLGFSDEVLIKNQDIEGRVREYLGDYYNQFKPERLKISIHPRSKS
ncbi:MAG: hypothetical protein JW784_03525 [Candidatus Cloacimonetes bacterium]|nr:hypothetical protein [Candidatus Cloacimonadota bacterium]